MEGSIRITPSQYGLTRRPNSPEAEKKEAKKADEVSSNNKSTETDSDEDANHASSFSPVDIHQARKKVVSKEPISVESDSQATQPCSEHSSFEDDSVDNASPPTQRWRVEYDSSDDEIGFLDPAQVELNRGEKRRPTNNTEEGRETKRKKIEPRDEIQFHQNGFDEDDETMNSAIPENLPGILASLSQPRMDYDVDFPDFLDSDFDEKDNAAVSDNTQIMTTILDLINPALRSHESDSSGKL